MKAVSAVLGVTTVMTLLFSLAGESRAGGVIECNNCPSPSDAALGIDGCGGFRESRVDCFRRCTCPWDRKVASTSNPGSSAD